MTTASDLYYTQVRGQLDPIQWEALTRREQAGWVVAAGMVDDRLSATAETILKHGHSGTINSREGWVGCLCGENLPLPGGFDFDGYALDPDEEDRVRAAHLADALLAQSTPTTHPDPTFPNPTQEQNP